MATPQFKVGGEITRRGIRYYVRKNGKKIPKRFRTRKAATSYALRQLMIYFKRTRKIRRFKKRIRRRVKMKKKGKKKKEKIQIN